MMQVQRSSRSRAAWHTRLVAVAAVTFGVATAGCTIGDVTPVGAVSEATAADGTAATTAAPATPVLDRSEERRVGKECLL